MIANQQTSLDTGL